MKIVINSHTKSNIALLHLLDSMKQYKEHLEFEMIVVIGGYYDHTDYQIETQGNITYIKSMYNSIDYTGLIALLELYKNDEYYFYMHDTCKVGPDFFNKLRSIDLTNVSSIRIHAKYSMNIGIYSSKIINIYKEFLLDFKNTSEKHVMDFKYKAFRSEDHIFRQDTKNSVLDKYAGWSYTGPTDYYNTGTMRIVEHYPSLDLYKIKANFFNMKPIIDL